MAPGEGAAGQEETAQALPVRSLDNPYVFPASSERGRPRLCILRRDGANKLIDPVLEFGALFHVSQVHEKHDAGDGAERQQEDGNELAANG